jgi:NDP-sugar pyrophosphorylase family protein
MRFEHLHGAGIREFIVQQRIICRRHFNRPFLTETWRGCPVAFRHEPVLLETGGGLANVADLLGDDEAFAVYNGDVFTGLRSHRRWRNIAPGKIW